MKITFFQIWLDESKHLSFSNVQFVKRRSCQYQASLSQLGSCRSGMASHNIIHPTTVRVQCNPATHAQRVNYYDVYMNTLTHLALGLNEIGAVPGGAPMTFCEPE